VCDKEDVMIDEIQRDSLRKTH